LFPKRSHRGDHVGLGHQNHSKRLGSLYRTQAWALKERQGRHSGEKWTPSHRPKKGRVCVPAKLGGQSVTHINLAEICFTFLAKRSSPFHIRQQHRGGYPRRRGTIGDRGNGGRPNTQTEPRGGVVCSFGCLIGKDSEGKLCWYGYWE